jgi:hypothetical protein
MNDIRKLSDLFDELEIEYKLSPYIEGLSLCVEAYEGERVVGHAGHEAFWIFDAKGKFIKVGLW